MDFLVDKHFPQKQRIAAKILVQQQMAEAGKSHGPQSNDAGVSQVNLGGAHEADIGMVSAGFEIVSEIVHWVLHTFEIMDKVTISFAAVFIRIAGKTQSAESSTKKIRPSR
jgi:hypothetical protein